MSQLPNFPVMKWIMYVMIKHKTSGAKTVVVCMVTFVLCNPFLCILNKNDFCCCCLMFYQVVIRKLEVCMRLCLMKLLVQLLLGRIC